MTFKANFDNLRGNSARGTSTRGTDRQRNGRWGRVLGAACDMVARHPGPAMAVLLGAGLAAGIGGGTAWNSQLNARVAAQEVQLATTRDGAQREINALAARLGELQAQANRLNALGERLTRVGQLQDGEFDFDQPVPTGGTGPVSDMPAGELRQGLQQLEREFAASDEQLTVLESLLFDRELDRNAVPSREPIANSYITSSFGGRADPIRGGRQFHKGIDFEADVGDPVLSVADGVVSFAGVRSGYGNVIEVDHGNGNSTLYAHLSRVEVRRGQRVERGQRIGAVGATGWATGPHLHFEFKERGVQKDPLVVAKRYAPATELTAQQRTRFNLVAQSMRTQLAVAATANMVASAR